MLLFRTSLRYLLRHPWQAGLCVLGVALGVAMVVAIDLANASARQAFSLSTETIAGRATHQIRGGPAGLDESLYREIRVEQGIRNSAPLVEGYVQLPALDERTFQVFGVDPLAEAPFRNYLAGADFEGRELDLAPLYVEPGAVLMAAQTAARYDLVVGDELELQVGPQQYTATLVGLLQPADDLSARTLEGLLIADIATAQEMLGMLGRLSRIDLIIPEGEAGAAMLARVEQVLPPGAELTRPETRSATLEQMTRAFELNLAALSLLALVVGMFLIYNTMTFSVVQRRSLIGTLRCIGVSRRQIGLLLLGEALLISLVGAAIGLLLGTLLGRGLVQLVTRTINDLYFVVTVRSLAIEPFVLLKGLLLGIIATLAATAVPAFEAIRTPPRMVLQRSSVEERVRRLVPRAAAFGLGLLLLGLLLLWLTPERGMLGLQGAFAGLFAVIIGCALLTPLVLLGLMAALRPLLGRFFGLLGRMASRDLVNNLSRSAVAVAALMIAISVTIGVGIMVGSFRQTVVQWLEQTLIADIYVSPPSTTATRVDSDIDRELVAQFAAQPGIVARTFFRSVQVDTETGPVTLVAIATNSEQGRSAVNFIEGGDEASWRLFEQGGLLISEPLAFRSGLGVGDTLRLRTDRGQHDFPIAGVYYDYTSDRGVIRMDYGAYREYWDDPALSSFALYVADDREVDAVVQELRDFATTLGAPGEAAPLLVISSNRALRAGTLEIFDRTFAITAVLQMLATIVAFIGILSALMALQLERARELAMLRANGLTPRQLWGLVISQTGLMGLAAGLLAMPVGIMLALVLIFVINRRSFGWTLNLALDPALFGQALLVAVLAAVLAGVYPALKMARTNPALALREE
jgi:putative ABC transport system permease protein